MSVFQSHWRTLIVGLCFLGLMPVVGETRNDDNEIKKSHKSQKYEKSQKSQKSYKYEASQKERLDKKNVKRKPSKTQTVEKKRSDIKHQKTINNRTEQRIKTERSKSIDKRRAPNVISRQPKNSHDINYRTTLRKQKIVNDKSQHAFRHYETYRYHTHYLAPIRYHYYPLNYRLTVLPRLHARLLVLGVPYFYFEGIFYQRYQSGYVVVSAPVGGHVRVLPAGFIAFNIGMFTYYYVNDVYYRWDDDFVRYVVVKKPDGSDVAIDEATEGRLFSYPNKGQTQEQQTKDRYECHSWAVSESQVDPTLDEDAELSQQDKDNYKRAISACLQGRDYTVK